MNDREPVEHSLTIGGTPLHELFVRVGRHHRRVLLKREEYNPFGSIKDRTAYSLLHVLEAARPGEQLTIVESTSGNLGAAMAALCHLQGHEFIAVVDPKVSPGNLALMRRFGAAIETIDTADEYGNYLMSRIRRVREICAENPDAVWSNQYANAANPQVHYRETAPEILKDADDAIGAVFVAVSTGGTLRGLSDRFREESPGTTVVAVDVEGSIALGGAPNLRRLNGIGANRPSQFLDDAHYDEKILVRDTAAIATCRSLRDQTGIFLGGSGGAALAACLRHLMAHPETGLAVCVCPDGGGEYSETLYSDSWIAEQDIRLDDDYRWMDVNEIRFTSPVSQ
ncbi:pyridoxal-phosphate dependent enzyme [Actinoplanes sp. NPDC051851]|uniref:pyridoxal-phosphate dependent enzyme n=1 Tax=Actinoplanes sp. NPDC051851 TaxID=3154753 RepID=UPI0034472E55